MNDLMTKSFISYVDLKKAAVKDIEMGMAETQSTDPKLELFLEEAERVKGEMEAIRNILVRLEAANEESKSLHKPDAFRSLRSQINADIVTVLKNARTIKTQLEEMDNQRLSMKNPIDRTRNCVIIGLRKKLKELMTDFQDLRERMMAEYKETVGRCYYTVTGEQPDEETMEKIMDNGVGVGEILAEAIKEHGRGNVMETVLEIKDRHDAAKEVERSLLELHQVFLDMAVMVEAQGEQMDDIEHHVMNAGHYVKDGSKELKSAKEYQRSSRKWFCVGIILLLLIVILVVIPIVSSFSNS
ncbi:hypothetical protein Nepgr_015226 [Nepenthes gracilis]|uniref:t-SNARE coiled-coil homology domain-containing protein n=1 Tax=Nepenthes gracilis TaxID=150966 RepID=A0AAD3SKN2_NEPGR|nr:hypothetical protein Nepgr_015226 [Nepenthes gracilis]